jgi:hypothetical protein
MGFRDWRLPGLGQRCGGHAWAFAVPQQLVSHFEILQAGKASGTQVESVRPLFSGFFPGVVKKICGDTRKVKSLLQAGPSRAEVD